MFLLDTVVVSEAMKRRPSDKVIGWLSQQDPAALFVSTITLGEIQRGIAAVRRTEPDFALRLGAWLSDLRSLYGDRILSVTDEIALRWGELSAELGNDGFDLLIAATALQNRLTVATRNLRHFEGTGVALFDPFTA
jgi:predicted nucleic acid-binding protein